VYTDVPWECNTEEITLLLLLMLMMMMLLQLCEDVYWGYCQVLLISQKDNHFNLGTVIKICHPGVPRLGK